ncbi:heme exporter protein CcmD [Xinfangfangia sp. D13-10-4-6]|uniref:heme exporter protein CcmD n=1 Tax=Pseudogemmobacter hezensis TaxID=2737662 RepID=UPI001557B690|nr:heme exporter protein CcmD [Pseudogemmobacter hezensis]NPD15328.1 heme exporter protein CcmD [Pseudogemmobacter hezensis]
MMPDLGKYTVAVLGAWGAALVLLAGLLAVTLWQGARMRKALALAEARAAAERPRKPEQAE